jgi:DNA replication ATP-dependent helicase Dna2
LKLIGHLLKARPFVEIHTVDKYQGRDKECVIVSLVRSNPQGHVGDLLQDWRRINVAFTRAKKKLIVLGSFSTLEKAELLGKFVKLVQAKGFVYPLPAAAHQKHCATPPSSTQFTSFGGMSSTRRSKDSDTMSSASVELS